MRCGIISSCQIANQLPLRDCKALPVTSPTHVNNAIYQVRTLASYSFLTFKRATSDFQGPRTWRVKTAIRPTARIEPNRIKRLQTKLSGIRTLVQFDNSVFSLTLLTSRWEERIAQKCPIRWDEIRRQRYRQWAHSSSSLNAALVMHDVVRVSCYCLRGQSTNSKNANANKCRLYKTLSVAVVCWHLCRHINCSIDLVLDRNSCHKVFICSEAYMYARTTKLLGYYPHCSS